MRRHSRRTLSRTARDDLILGENLKLCGWEYACDVAEAAGAVFEGRKHDALADARGVAAGFIALIRKGGPNPLSP